MLVRMPRGQMPDYAGQDEKQSFVPWKQSIPACRRSRIELAERLCARLGTLAPVSAAAAVDAGPHEAHMLQLDSAKARSRLGWRPVWGIAEIFLWSITKMSRTAPTCWPGFEA